MSTAPHLFSTPLATLRPAIDLKNVTKRFTTPDGSTYTAIRDMTLQVAPGEFCAIVGPTGCGKSTSLTLISGLERPSAGSVSVHGEPVKGITPGVGFMFQTDAVLPWKSVLDNVAMGPKFRGIDKANAIASAKDWIRRVGLAGFEDRFPHQLSGGMRKRVALAQSLINEPEILLMDEPFSALDVQTRAIMSNELLGLWDVTKPAVVFVTHDLEEAIALADKVVVMTAGPGGTVKETFAIDLPRPRVVQEIRFDKRFVDLYQQIWESLRSEVDTAYSQSTQTTGKAS
ncbi:ABC transporter ATP-binding protein [Lacisediminihabitans profunda]|uniref:ABC transporter ATP-binding protein n=1 Tax=Lacisediminihabitans profunda TaxID=2594790 RepID=A0A5C8USI1_9MICO|nr:ABC transporter ATP-binding protein [Lacisediminihabitans profunda]TXN31561.1 ABC transporter ATP-binding protein [Lacisediminihabitans profunda]